MWYPQRQAYMLAIFVQREFSVVGIFFKVRGRKWHHNFANVLNQITHKSITFSSTDLEWEKEKELWDQFHGLAEEKSEKEELTTSDFGIFDSSELANEAAAFSSPAWVRVFFLFLPLRGIVDIISEDYHSKRKIPSKRKKWWCRSFTLRDFRATGVSHSQTSLFFKIIYFTFVISMV